MLCFNLNGVNHDICGTLAGLTKNYKLNFQVGSDYCIGTFLFEVWSMLFYWTMTQMQLEYPRISLCIKLIVEAQNRIKALLAVWLQLSSMRKPLHWASRFVEQAVLGRKINHRELWYLNRCCAMKATYIQRNVVYTSAKILSFKFFFSGEENRRLVTCHYIKDYWDCKGLWLMSLFGVWFWEVCQRESSVHGFGFCQQLATIHVRLQNATPISSNISFLGVDSASRAVSWDNNPTRSFFWGNCYGRTIAA